MKCCVVAIFVLFSCASGAHLPSNFKICKRSDPNFNQCLGTAIEDAVLKLENGNSDFKFPVIEPITIAKLAIDRGTGPVQVVQNYNDVKVYDTTKLKVKDIKLTTTETEFSLEGVLYFENIRFEAEYSLDGQILVLPITGNGTCTLNLKKVTSDFKLSGDVINKKGKNYAHFTKFEGDLRPENIQLEFKNLFNGDKTLGDQMNKVLNENSIDVFNDVKHGYIRALGEVFIDLGNRIFKKVPLDEVFPQ